MTFTLHQIDKSFHDIRTGKTTPAVHDLNFTVNDGEFVTLIGPSGCGKSTAFNMITGLVQPTSGDIFLNEKRINGQPGYVGYMAQRDLLLPWRSVIKNVTIGAEVMRTSEKEMLLRARELLPLFGLDQFADNYPSALSGGMRQRAALLRTFLLDKQVMLLDEPFGALDALTRHELQLWLLEVWEKFKTTILFITHDVREAVLMSDRVLVFTPRPGKIALELKINLPRPRLDSDPEFLSLQSALLRALTAR